MNTKWMSGIKLNFSTKDYFELKMKLDSFESRFIHIKAYILLTCEDILTFRYFLKLKHNPVTTVSTTVLNM